jgi:hypothetical protein
MSNFIGKRVTDTEAGNQFPNSYVLMRRDSDKLGEESGVILWLGDDEKEVYKQLGSLDDLGNCTVVTGIDKSYSLLGSIF